MARKPKNTLKTRIAIVLDRSGSMASLRKEAIEMFNEQVKTIKKAAKGVDTKVSLFTFSSFADEPRIWNQSSESLRPLTAEDYSPNGGTAMYDSLGMAIDRLSSLAEGAEKDCSFLVITITDGEENSSIHYTGSVIADRIKLLQSTGKWTFTFMGANIDVEKMSQTLNVARGNTVSWSTSSAGVFAASAINSSGTEQYLKGRSAGIGATASFYSPPEAETKTTTHITLDPNGGVVITQPATPAAPKAPKSSTK